MTNCAALSAAAVRCSPTPNVWHLTFAPGGDVQWLRAGGNQAYIGTGAVIKQGQPGQPVVIGHGAVVGMGAVVTKSVPPGVTVVGNPAKPLVNS